MEASGSSSSAAKSQLSDAVGEVVEENPNGQISGPPGLKEFSFADLKTATSNFGPDVFLGETANGRVYKGWIDEKTLAPTEMGTGTGLIEFLEQIDKMEEKLNNPEFHRHGHIHHRFLASLKALNCMKM